MNGEYDGVVRVRVKVRVKVELRVSVRATRGEFRVRVMRTRGSESRASKSMQGTRQIGGQRSVRCNQMQLDTMEQVSIT